MPPKNVKMLLIEYFDINLLGLGPGCIMFDSFESLASIEGRGGNLATEVEITTISKKVESNMLHL